jgi:hypothetical protein
MMERENTGFLRLLPVAVCFIRSDHKLIVRCLSNVSMDTVQLEILCVHREDI